MIACRDEHERRNCPVVLNTPYLLQVRATYPVKEGTAPRPTYRLIERSAEVGQSSLISWRSRLGASAGLRADGTQPGNRERPPARRSAEIFRRINSRAGLELRPFHKEKKATVESTTRKTRLDTAEGEESARCTANSAARNSRQLMCSILRHG